MISDVPRQKLGEIVRRYGTSVAEDSRKCEGLLKDFCGGYRREIHGLVYALKERTAEELLSTSDGIPQEVLVARLAKRLEDYQGLDKELAHWVVESWGLALGRLSIYGGETQREERSVLQIKERERLRLEEERSIELERQRLQRPSV